MHPLQLRGEHAQGAHGKQGEHRFRCIGCATVGRELFERSRERNRRFLQIRIHGIPQAHFLLLEQPRRTEVIARESPYMDLCGFIDHQQRLRPMIRLERRFAAYRLQPMDQILDRRQRIARSDPGQKLSRHLQIGERMIGRITTKKLQHGDF
jgi:hypothetical protein